MPMLEITGPFYQITWAEIDAPTAKSILDGTKDIVDLRYELEEHHSWQSIYGASEPSLELNETALYDYEQICELAEKQEGLRQRNGELTTYPDVSIDLGKRDPSKIFFICREICNGSEQRVFQDSFSLEKLDINRISIWAGDEELADVVMINYDDAEIVDNTQSDYDGFFIFHNGQLINLSE